MKTKEKITIKRKVSTHLNVEDFVYINGSLWFSQPNLNSINRKGSSKFKCRNGKILEVDLWEWAEKD